MLNNDVINTFKQGSGTATGIVFAATNDGLAVINRITSSDLGIDFQIGSTGKYRDTLTFGVTTPFHGGTPVGTNS